MRVYDCFTFFNEIELLKFRLEFLYEHVDKFIISEANITFSGQQKPFYFSEHKREFSRWINKIEYLQCQPDVSRLSFEKPSKYKSSHASWKVEKAQRDFLAAGLFGLNDDDLVILTDIDEIWNPSILQDIRSNEINFRAARLEMSFHYFYMNCRGIGSENKFWLHPVCMKYFLLRDDFKSEFASFRSGDVFRKTLKKFLLNKPVLAPSLIHEAGWHFSYLGGAQAVIKKIESFSHQELNNAKVKEYSRIERCIELGLDPFDRSNHIWQFYPINSFPEKLANLMRKYPQFIKAI
jgi:beta-1,4-mannosyl-glycoprotein beta-1,4-N-acetylglucosaminyltransferase